MMRNPYRQGSGHRGDPNLGRKCLVVSAWFVALMVAMEVSAYAVVMLPATAIVTVLLCRETDFFGLMLCLLLPLSFSYGYQVGQVPEIVLITRLLLVGLIILVYFKVLRAPFEYKYAAACFGLFILTSAVSSYYHSQYVGISEAKLAFCAMFLGGLLVVARPSSGFPHVAVGVIAAIGFLSFLYFLVRPEIGYAFVLDPNSGGTLAGKFSGIMNHPQLLAALLAVNLPLMLYAFISKTGTASLLGLGAFLTSLLLIAVSSSRTGMLAAIVGCVSALYFYRKHATSATMRLRLNLVAFCVFLVVAVGSVLASDQVRAFVFKTDDVQAGFSLSGRDQIIRASWDGFVYSPIFGNGFQVPSDFTERGAASFGLSSDATTIEKCFFLTMLLEEVGLIGTLLFLAMLSSLISQWRRKGSYVALSALIAFLVVNTGESCILSPSSLGGLCWLSIFAVHNLRLGGQPSHI